MTEIFKIFFNKQRRCSQVWGGGCILTLRQSDPWVETTGRKSHDTLKPVCKSVCAKCRQIVREQKAMVTGGKGLCSLHPCFSQSDAGVCRHRWSRPRCGLQHRDHYRGNKKQGSKSGEQVK
ncbi:hypothetical protein XENORESO_004214 [Xenotaenia resolanae]|uniref:Uncharacterized protein n=1 Tax=Xenotaenia resolanae TaxID=208358 RepID=A0ABV0WF48_9TELE